MSFMTENPQTASNLMVYTVAQYEIRNGTPMPMEALLKDPLLFGLLGSAGIEAMAVRLVHMNVLTLFQHRKKDILGLSTGYVEAMEATS